MWKSLVTSNFTCVLTSCIHMWFSMLSELNAIRPVRCVWTPLRLKPTLRDLVFSHKGLIFWCDYYMAGSHQNTYYVIFDCKLIANWNLISITRFQESEKPLLPPRFLEKFGNRSVKHGASITLSVKVEGNVDRCISYCVYVVKCLVLSFLWI